jgi:1-acyl-sn-glycerol-3-phosphate acyltransferase
MSDLFYDTLWYLGIHVFWLSSSPTVIGAEHTRREGPFILAANHQSPYDIPLLMRHSARRLDFVSIVEVFQNPFVAWLYGSMNAFPLDRNRPDAPTVRILLDRLKRGRAVCMFPEGRLRRGPDSVIHTRHIKPGIGRIAQLANVPILPCVIVNSPAYSKFRSWLPLRRTRYGIIFGPPLQPSADPSETERQLVHCLVELHAELSRRSSDGKNRSPGISLSE